MSKEKLDKKIGFTHDSAKNISVDWYTPKWVFDSLGITFDLDPCHPKNIIPWIPVKKTFNIEDDGLKQKWEGNIWCNPPYGNETKLWLKRMHEHRNGISLVFARTDCLWFHDYVKYADGVLFLKGRIKFVDGLGKTGDSGSDCGSMLISWGKENTEVLKRLSNLGFFVEGEKEEEDVNDLF